MSLLDERPAWRSNKTRVRLIGSDVGRTQSLTTATLNLAQDFVVPPTACHFNGGEGANHTKQYPEQQRQKTSHDRIVARQGVHRG